MKQALALMTAIILTSCTNTVENVKAGVQQDSREIRGKIANELYPEGALLTPAVTTREYTYCYKSWADVSCYKEPVRGQEYILMERK